MNVINIDLEVGGKQCFQFFGNPEESVLLIFNNNLELTITPKNGDGYTDGIDITYTSEGLPFVWGSLNQSWEDTEEPWQSTEGYENIIAFLGDSNTCGAYESERLEYLSNNIYIVMDIDYLPLGHCTSGLCFTLLIEETVSNWVIEEGDNYIAENDDNMVHEI